MFPTFTLESKLIWAVLAVSPVTLLLAASSATRTLDLTPRSRKWRTRSNRCFCDQITDSERAN